ncbi:unnamed protein product [Linum tenue]|uniref:Uncharacterized protein n=1 Tax=Linum tenue TaxID=586396 RepID=A0AAV0QGB8_9ROSI|nr:unnamed protein product [Linum tenue]
MPRRWPRRWPSRLRFGLSWPSQGSFLRCRCTQLLMSATELLQRR